MLKSQNSRELSSHCANANATILIVLVIVLTEWCWCDLTILRTFHIEFYELSISILMNKAGVFCQFTPIKPMFFHVTELLFMVILTFS